MEEAQRKTGLRRWLSDAIGGLSTMAKAIDTSELELLERRVKALETRVYGGGDAETIPRGEG
ncbi:hypothetical protein [Mesorhizobium cantuariense]|uniref:Uncharacterized protein n=1 Tax=Mesorhizobium cantuariense TaxID=1300275 RepID=A0ABV7MK03_9HYPH